ncbi:hypothetical protein F8388_007682 [Cannabis sativa]|uniref:Auxin efflux carrier n=1 Tax=Cannabis sativa TaxID=3483 RepID=A0A7J6G3X0_CANSA|nr:hypothetical protein F8388_007682 [Cannabis sativa]KAF4377681.1 hypothetical protein G4B88_006961 [Cannabis sativa]
MGFWNMLEVASMPILEVLIVSLIGAFLASHYSNLLPLHMLSSLNKLVFVVFSPCYIFASLVQTITLEDLISWWFMPLNILLTFVIGGILGWIVVKITRPKPHLEGLIIATCSAGNLGNLVIIIVPAICNETGTPFGDTNKCRSAALSYASFSMAELEHISSLSSGSRVGQILHMIREELLAPPTIAVFVGLLFGATKWLKNLIIGPNAPLRVIQGSAQLLGDGTQPCITLLLGGNLIHGNKTSIKAKVLIGVICSRYILLPGIGILIVKGANQLGLLPSDPLFLYLLMLQFTLPPAMNISTMTQLFNVAQEECSLLFLWTYLLAAPALTIWSTIYISILSHH